MKGIKGVLVLAAAAGLIAGSAAGCASSDKANMEKNSCKGGSSCKADGSCKAGGSCKGESSCGKNSCG